MTDVVAAATEFRARLNSFCGPPPEIALPHAAVWVAKPGEFAGINPLEMEGGLALLAASFRLRLRAFGDGDAERSKLYRSPFEPA